MVVNCFSLSAWKLWCEAWWWALFTPSRNDMLPPPVKPLPKQRVAERVELLQNEMARMSIMRWPYSR